MAGTAVPERNLADPAGSERKYGGTPVLAGTAVLADISARNHRCCARRNTVSTFLISLKLCLNCYMKYRCLFSF